MIWFTLRQFRAQTWVTLIGFVAAGVALTITGMWMADLYATSGLATCQSACADLVDNFLGKTEQAVNVAGQVLYAVPALIGLFWGAPLIAREFEAGTYRLVWNQSITRTRWLFTKIVTIGLVSMATAGLLSLAMSVWAQRFDQAAMNRIEPYFFAVRGVVPVAYAAFAFVLGVTAGLLIRRTVPAMAVTLALYIGAVVSMSTWVRVRLLPVDRITQPLDTSALYGMMITDDNNRMELIGPAEVPGGWVISNQVITPSGDPFIGPPHPQLCGPDSAHQECMNWVDTLGLRQDITFHPADHFWPLQWIESGIFMTATLLLAGVCFWWVNRRVT